jgi:hypothetical protein
MYMSTDKQPIGWWVKQLDRSLEESFDRLLAGHGADRRQWQLLNLAARGGRVDELEPFLAGDGAPVAGLVERGWIRSDEGVLGLTGAGAAARERLAVEVRAQRVRAMDGIEPAEYTATVDVLRRMAANLAA